MPFHGHGLDVMRLVLRHVDADGSHRLGHVEHLVNTHADVIELEQPLQFLINLQCDEADTDVRFNPPSCKMEHRAYLQFRLRNSESPFHVPEIMVGRYDLVSGYAGVGQVALQAVPPLVFPYPVIVDADRCAAIHVKELVVAPAVNVLLAQ